MVLLRFLWRGCGSLAAWPSARAAFTRLGLFRAWGQPRAAPSGSPCTPPGSWMACCVCPTVTPCPQPSQAAPFPAWDLSWTEQRLGSLAASWGAAPHGPTGVGASVQGAHQAASEPVSGPPGVGTAGCSGPWQCSYSV